MNGTDGPTLPDDRSVAGQCEHCDWTVVVDSYSAVAEAYQDHLRSAHPEVWLRR